MILLVVCYEYPWLKDLEKRIIYIYIVAVTTRVRDIWNNVNAVGERWVLGSGFWADIDIKFCEISLAAQALKLIHSDSYL